MALCGNQTPKTVASREHPSNSLQGNILEFEALSNYLKKVDEQFDTNISRFSKELFNEMFTAGIFRQMNRNDFEELQELGLSKEECDILHLASDVSQEGDRNRAKYFKARLEEVSLGLANEKLQKQNFEKQISEMQKHHGAEINSLVNETVRWKNRVCDIEMRQFIVQNFNSSSRQKSRRSYSASSRPEQPKEEQFMSSGDLRLSVEKLTSLSQKELWEFRQELQKTSENLKEQLRPFEDGMKLVEEEEARRRKVSDDLKEGEELDYKAMDIRVNPSVPLYNDALGQILLFMEPKDLARYQAVSSSMKRLIRKLFHSQRKVTLRNGAEALFVTKHYSKLTHLEFQSREDWSVRVCRQLILQNKHLEHINIYANSILFNAIYSVNLPLTSLIVRSIRYNPSFEKIGRSLKHLSLTFLGGDTALLHSVADHCPNLESLQLKTSWQWIAGDDGVFRKLGTQCQKLTKLVLGETAHSEEAMSDFKYFCNLTSLTTAFPKRGMLLQTAKYLTNLTELNLRSAHVNLGSDLKAVAIHCRKLKILRLPPLSIVPKVVLRFFLEAVDLRELCLNSAHQFKSLISYGDIVLNGLQTLHVPCSLQNVETCEKIGTFAPNLRCVVLRQSSEEQDAELVKFLNKRYSVWHKKKNS